MQAQSPASAGDTRLAVIELKPMEQSLVKVTAESMKTDITSSGHVALYGIYFDTNRSDVKPESDAKLAEIARLLANEPPLKLHVVGHTDSVGDLTKNMELSHARANAVVKVLTARHKVAGARLHPDGGGPLSPVASNADEAGRAKNRRVELVAQ